jgi:hypothetical protein
VDPITAIIIAAAGAALARIIWFVDRQQDRKLILLVAKEHPKRINDVAKAIERTRYRRWKWPGGDEPKAVEDSSGPP